MPNLTGNAERYRTLFESMDEGFCIIEFLDSPHGPLSDYIHVEANAAYERHAGIANVVGQKVREMVPDEADGWVELYGGVLHSGNPIRFQRELVATGHHLEVHSFRVGPFEDRQVAVLFKDITDRVQAERAQRELQETLEARITEALAEREEVELALRQAQKMEAVGQLTGGLAHDFNNLLAGITGAFEMIGVRLAQGRVGDVEKYLAAGQGAARRAAALTHRLLAFSRRQTLTPKPVVVNRMLGDLSELVRRTVGPQINVETVAAAGLWPAMVDVNQLENALLNLCINARDAMPDGGTITIETANRWLDDRTARDHNLTAGQYVTICVSDTGTGIDKAMLDRVFDPFFTTKPIGQGTGLGLSMVYGFARQTGGAALIRSQLGKGTTVELFLPRSEQAVETAGPPAGLADAPEGSGATILVVDDEVLVRMVVAESLTDAGFKVLEAGTARDGLALLEAHPEISALLTDVGLPGGMTGRELARAAREAHPDLGIMFMTGYDDEASSGPALAGAEVLLKPFAFDVMVRRMVELTSGA